MGGTTSGANGGDQGSVAYPFEAQAPKIYVNKIKTLLTGLSATPNEVLVGSNDDGLRNLVDTWMKTDAYQQTLMTFFKLAFQLSLFDMEQISDQVPYGNHPASSETQMLIESFPRTVLDLVNNNRPFTEIATTTRFMVTPRLLFYYALMDQFGDGNDETGDYFKSQFPDLTIDLYASGGARDLNDLTNASSPNFMKFPWSGLSAPSGSCVPDTCMQNCGHVSIAPDTFTYSRGGNIWTMLQGGDFIYYVPPGNYCFMANHAKDYLTPADDSTWRLVNIRTPNPNETPTRIYDLNAFRSASEVVFRIPRIGYFTQPAFLAQWGTNDNNQARVTINQTMIVGLNRVFNGSDRTMPTDLRALPVEHAQPNSSCYGCHLTMDPMRQYFIQTLGNSYHPQVDPNLSALPGAWAQKGVSVAGGNLSQLGAQIAKDQDFSLAWVLKTCEWLNSAPCDAQDDEVVRIAQNFASTQYNFNAMMKDVLTSPLTTYKSTTLTATQRGAAASVARRDQFCRTMSARLNQPDICNYGAIPALMASYPADSYSRATTVLAQAREPTLVTRLVMENICSTMSLTAVDDGSNPFLSSQDPNQAIGKILTDVMGLQPDADASVLDILLTHYKDATTAGLSETDALRSCFVVACLSPYVATIGQ
jgi:hypothetical protein